MADVFISYKSERVGAVAHLAEIIEAHGFTVWFDVRGLDTGPSFGPQIEAALRDAQVVLVLWCSLSRDSQWVIEEADLAKELGTYNPVHMEAGASPPLGYRTDQALKLQDWNGDPDQEVLDKIFHLLEKRLGREAVTARRRMRELKTSWQMRGSPNFLGEKLAAVPTEATVRRAWPKTGGPRVSEPALEPPSQPNAETPSARVWTKVKGSVNLEDYEIFLRAFPNAPEAESCKAALAELAKRKDTEALVAARRSAFDALPRDGYDVSVYDEFLAKHSGTEMAFDAAKLRQECLDRLAALPEPDEGTKAIWELDAVVSLLTGCSVPHERRQFISRLEFDPFSDTLFEALRRSDADLGRLFHDPRAESFLRTIVFPAGVDFVQFTNLTAIKFARCVGVDVNAFTSNENLKEIDLFECRLENVSALKNCKNLKDLSVWGIEIGRDDFLKDFKYLKRLSLAYQTGLDLSYVTEMTNLCSLTLHSMEIYQLPSLEKLKKLESLDISKNPILSIYEIQGLSNIERINLSHTDIEDIEILRDLPRLKSVNLMKTDVQDWSPVDHLRSVGGRPKDWVR